MSNESIIKLTPTDTPNSQIHLSNKSITDQIIQLHQILASASAPSVNQYPSMHVCICIYMYSCVCVCILEIGRIGATH